ncbi:MAG: hypothetical protein IKM19_03635 [Firmicutes bacterium]|nr:hypothetical protein [Bacillota bacterium]
MVFKGVNFRKVYKPIEPLEDDAFLYVRAIRGEMIGFSVLDKIMSPPGFSQCGVFWMKPEDFLKMFEEL